MHSSEAVVHRSVNGTVCYDILGFLSMMNFATDLILPLADSVLSTLYTFRPCSSMMWRIILLRCLNTLGGVAVHVINVNLILPIEDPVHRYDLVTGHPYEDIGRLDQMCKR